MSVSTVGTTPDGYDFRYSPHGITGLEHGGNQYVFAAEGAESGVGDLQLHVIKSTDNGATWNDVGSVMIGPVPSVTVCQDGDTVYVLSTDTHNGGTSDLCAALAGWTFNLTSDTFSTIALSGAPQVYKFWHGPTPSAYQINKCVGLSLVRRAAGSFWFVYQGTPEAIAGSQFARLWVASFDGSSFSGATVVGGQTGSLAFSQGGAALDPSGNLHLILGSTSGRKYYHIGMDSAGAFGTFQTIETDGFFVHLDPPEEVSNVVNFNLSGDKIGFIGVNNSASSNGDIVLYYGDASLTPTWSTAVVHPDGDVPVVIDPSMGSALSTAIAFTAATSSLHVFWAVSGSTPTWSLSGGLGRICHSFASLAALSSWSTPDVNIMAPTVGDFWTAAVVNTWLGESVGLAILGCFSENNLRHELALFNAITLPHPPAIDCASPPVGTRGIAYSHQMTLSGGTGPYTVTVTAGSLPAGLAISNTALITGTPMFAGTDHFTIHVTDSLGDTASVDCAISVGAVPIFLACADPPNGAVGVDYVHQMLLLGGSGPFFVQVYMGSLPPGLEIDSVVMITGVPTTAGTYPFRVKVTELGALGRATEVDCSITIRLISDQVTCEITIHGPLQADCNNPPLAAMGVDYTHQFDIRGGEGPYTVEVVRALSN
jgi:hypothetical protein